MIATTCPTARATAIASWVLLAAGASFGQEVDHFVQQLIEQRAIGRNDVRGLVDEIRIGNIEQGQTKILQFEIDPSQIYVLLGACDEYCTELDLIGYAGDNLNAIAHNSGDGDEPWLTIKSPGPNLLYVEAHMRECEDNSCTFGVGLYALK